MEKQLPYCNNRLSFSRLKTREVHVGSVAIGGMNPIRVQSMTTANTLDTSATAAEAMRIVDAGGEMVRITAPSIKEAQNLENIKDELRKNGYHVPLIADIHFTPNAAEVAAQIVEKVRINPGNYTDRKKFKVAEYSDKAYQEEVDKIRHRLIPLIKICKRNKTAIRIGVNHGSLSDRIMSRYGDTPLGMVESGLEFVQICEKEKFYDIILSMKSSNPLIMVHANRLLAAKMIESGRLYPIHLGVTESGEGEDGRIKSAVGIGTLLEDGIGDTIRVSLTEKPENEIPVAQTIVKRYIGKVNDKPISNNDLKSINPFEFKRRETNPVTNIGGKNPPRIIINLSRITNIKPSDLSPLGYDLLQNKWQISDQGTDYIFVGKQSLNFSLPDQIGIIQIADAWQPKPKHFPMFSLNEFFKSNQKSEELNFIKIEFSKIDEKLFRKINREKSIVLVLTSKINDNLHKYHNFIFELIRQKITTPIIIKNDYSKFDSNLLLLNSSIDIGALLTDGLIDGMWLESNQSPNIINQTSFGILQATRTRITKTEYISCPSCGRTQFYLPEVTAQIRSKTEHLKGIKIGIMGCIVNGPGEMADADYGYVGTGNGTITLYKGQEVIRKNIPSENAVEELFELIKEHGDWVERSA